MKQDDAFENEPGFWSAVFGLGRRLFLIDKEAVRERWAENYHDYLMSTPWKNKSESAKRRASNRCQLCNRPNNLQTHHRTYERLGNEDDGDLIVLCRECHKKFHADGER